MNEHVGKQNPSASIARNGPRELGIASESAAEAGARVEERPSAWLELVRHGSALFLVYPLEKANSL